MKTITKIIKIYEFSELDEHAKMKAVNNYINFLLEALPYEDMTDDMKKAIDKAEHIKTPWFAGSYIFDYCIDEITENVNDYSYLSDGNIYFDNI